MAYRSSRHTEIIFLLPDTEERRADWNEHQVNGVIFEQPEGCCATELKPSTDYPGMFELKVSGPHKGCEEFAWGFGQEPDIIDGIAMTHLAETGDINKARQAMTMEILERRPDLKAQLLQHTLISTKRSIQ